MYGMEPNVQSPPIISRNWTGLKLLLQVQHVCSHGQQNTLFGCCGKSEITALHLWQGMALRQIAGTLLQNIHGTLPFCNMLQTLQVKSSLEDVELPMRVDNRSCSCSLSE